MSEPRVPPEVVIAELRSYCDEKARFLLTRHIEGEAGLPDMILIGPHRVVQVDC